MKTVPLSIYAAAKNIIIFACSCQLAYGADGSESPTNTQRMNPNKELTIIIKQMSRDPDRILSRRPWLELEVTNTGTTKWYYDMEAEKLGMKITVTDPDGKPVPLNAEGKALEGFKELHRGNRYGAFTPRLKATPVLALGDYCKLEPGKTYRVEIEWVLNVHDFSPSRKVLEPEWTYRVTLKAPAVSVKMPND